jgi:hypothetical protein
MEAPRRNTDPIWIQDFYMMTGHDASTRSGTATFVKRKGKLWAVTCRHIMDAVNDRKMAPGATFPVLALMISSGALNLGNMGPNGVRHCMRAPSATRQEDEIDIAISPVGHYWELLTAKKNKVAIDLDHWKEPDWSALKWGIAAGYPDEHKSHVNSDDKLQVGNQLITAIAEISSTPSADSPIITLSSLLDNPHSWFFSGLSGGPLYAVEGELGDTVEDNALFPIGIVFEGYPSSGRPDIMGPRDTQSGFLTESDLFFRALTLTPRTFDLWLQGCEFT